MRRRRNSILREDSAMNVGRTTIAGAAFAVALALAGCQHNGSYDLPARFIPEPAGTRNAVLFGIQETKAERDDFIIRAHEWVSGSVTLADFGQRHVEGLVGRIPVEPFPVVVVTSGDENLDTARREALVEHLLIAGIVDAESIVVVGRDPQVGMRGEEAVSASGRAD
jgi:hypothetical protein